MEPTGGDATHLPTYVTLAPTYAPTCLPTMEPTFDPTTAPTAMEMDMDADIDVDRLELWQHDHDEQGEHRGWTRRGSHSEDDDGIAEDKHYGWSRKGRHNTSQDGVAKEETDAEIDAEIDEEKLGLWQHDHDEQGEHRGWTRRGSHSEDDERIAEGKHYGWSRKGRHNTSLDGVAEEETDADIDAGMLELWQHDHDEQGEHRGWTRRGSHSEDDERIAEGKHYGWSRKGRHNTSQDGVAIVDEEDGMSTFTPSTEPTAEPTTEPTSEPSTEPTATEPTIPPQMSARAKNGAAAGVDDEKMLSWMQPWWSNEESVEVEVEDAWLLVALLSLAMMICVAGVYRQWSSRKGVDEYRPIPDNCKVSTAMAYGSTLESNNV